MSQYKEFQGKSLDEAIQEACDFYGVPREKLEIEILSDAKSGIFGLVGAKKATIRASKVQLSGTVASLLDDDGAVEPVKERRQDASRKSESDDGHREQKAGRKPGGRSGHMENRPANRPGSQPGNRPDNRADSQPDHRPNSRPGSRPASQPDKQPGNQPGDQPSPSGALTSGCPGGRHGGRGGDTSGVRHSAAPVSSGDSGEGAARSASSVETAARAVAGTAPDKTRPARRSERSGSPFAAKPSLQNRSSKKHAAEPSAAPLAAGNGYGEDEVREDMPEFSLENCDSESLFALVRDVVLELVSPIVGPVPCTVELAGKRIRAVLDCGEASGLLVGRDGQTLAAVQYLAARIVSRKLGGAVRLQIDAGKYRERQDDRLRDLAHALAAKVKESGRPQTTRPLSAYQRRIVHLALEGDAAVTTRSKGEGPQRRVFVYLKRESGSARPEAGGGVEDGVTAPDSLIADSLANDAAYSVGGESEPVVSAHEADGDASFSEPFDDRP